jgi:lysophospholipase L1-like esterase
MKALCVFGDSLAKGIVYDDSAQKYFCAKDNFVSLFCEDSDVAYANFSKFGCTVTKGEKIVSLHPESIATADFTVLEFGGNDSDFNWNEISEDPDAHHEPKTPAGVFNETYKRIISKVKSAGGKPIMLNLPPLDPKRYFAWISKNLNAGNILKWLGGSRHFIYRYHEMYNMYVHRIAALLSVPIIDIRSAFLSKSDYSRYLCADGIHPNENGHRLISQTIKSIVGARLPEYEKQYT